jgi:hypothetical protein
LAFLYGLSKTLIDTGRAYSDVVTFGFWCRQAALEKERVRYDDGMLRVGKGIAFHVAPSNVPVNFAFSLVAGLLAGNANIVRVPSKEFEQVTIVCDAISRLLTEKHNQIAPYICIVRYPSDSNWTGTFSSLCDTRVIWGGDDTIARIRKQPLQARANEITFANRYSIAVIHADTYLKSENKRRIAQDFYNDTYYSDQNACTSPQMVIWLGAQKNEAKTLFWAELRKLVQEKYQLAPVQAIGKYTAFCLAATQKNISLVNNEDNYITEMQIDSLDEDTFEFRYHSGFFFEYDAHNIDELLPICTQKCQTSTYYGIDKTILTDFVEKCRPAGVDRIVPMGKSMDFSLVWDWYDLIRSMSRVVSVG